MMRRTRLSTTAPNPGVHGGQYYGPGGWAQMRGYPTLVQSSAKSHDADLQRRLWTVSEELTGVHYPLASGKSNSSS